MSVSGIWGSPLGPCSSRPWWVIGSENPRRSLEPRRQPRTHPLPPREEGARRAPLLPREEGGRLSARADVAVKGRAPAYLHHVYPSGWGREQLERSGSPSAPPKRPPLTPTACSWMFRVCNWLTQFVTLRPCL